MKRTLLASLLLLVLPYGAYAEEPAPLPEPPDLPPQVESGEVLEPEVTIIESEKGTIQEYRINGRMYMVKITPIAGPPYYLLDNDGDGEMDVRQEAHPGNIAIPQWVLFSW
ncbi:MAG: DUF2782 domain-containing protein [Sedimenticola sp.]|mgnify:CR=1 FL=1|uniref:DUF2782 domain-containing protein n=1 Tax=Sedimenticola thiotaurini TaxID=1543721 RepID=A0A558DGZ0_9GAMM|nr:DUF2782 domain-containing protein [Sedimenticola sp.]TVT60163.1 MAG: DUF2782 domain-containing protein [Sedimenticola thiotaurini]MCW8882778.1 DUF2782 domain-containing protein [Sedimenticola sp.]MCW8947012.1 DUF2782 domain-containing protein [Sedimenticola sp.]MCW8974865.1 DUF2782 domain-containing protein [Sedimenticola sp.]